jgi:hypothetical protein
MLNLDDYIYSETEESIILTSKEPDNDGFTFSITFTKDEKEHEESLEAIKDFFIREIL